MAMETHRPTCLLLMLLSALLPAAERQQTGTSIALRCLNNYGFQDRRVDCTWHRNQTTGEGPFYLNFSDASGGRGLRDLLCWLSPSKERRDEFSCSAEGPGEFEENDEYKLSLHNASGGRKVVYAAWEGAYEPQRNIQCDPPCDFRSNVSGSKCLIEWKMPEAYVVIWSAMQWQVQVRATHDPWEQAETKTVVTRETWMEIDASEFTPGTIYVARVRCKTPDSNDAYVSQWSPWSPTAEWRVPPGPLQQEETLVSLAVSVPLALGALLFLLLLAGFYSWAKRRCSASTPNPAAFFRPLYASHHGDFQAWIGIKEQDVWLRGGNSADPGKGAGLGPVTPWPLEAISPLSAFKRLSEVEWPSEGIRAWHLLAAPGLQDKASNYVVIQGEAQALILPGRTPLHAGEGFPYLPYKNSLFAEQEPQETEILSSCSKASCSPRASTHFMAPG